MATTTETGEPLTMAELERPLPEQEALAFAVLESPLRELYARERQSFDTASQSGDQPRVSEQRTRIDFLERLHTRMEEERYLAPPDAAARYVTDRLGMSVAEKLNLSLEARAGLLSLLAEGRDAYVAAGYRS